ncbi:MAG: hypothetical protein LBC85_10630 [Fibromonadaceae bacterium]|jgi:hypothetical protein|nr:hypothetical protein [Fibromonadaceae bacterium]
MKKLIAFLAVLSFLACSKAPPPSLQTIPKPNPSAPLAWFGVNNLDDNTRFQYAEAIQKKGIFNFIVEDLSEEQIDDAFEIRINYSEEVGKFNRIPVLRLQVELLQNGETKLRFTTREESDVTANSPMKKGREKKYRQELLLQRFLEELKRVRSEEKLGNCRG